MLNFQDLKRLAQGKLSIPFSSQSTFPITLHNIAAGQTVLSCLIQIREPFAPGVSLSVGTAADPARLIPSSCNMPSQLGTYANDEPDQFVDAQPLRLFGSGLSNGGSGVVIITLL